ncbi:MAG: malonyl-ACP O-methyltransferase BioC [Candidatus Omnitrophica bacterium]|nr:malonyl-ACP O-methyltransferase BioC [Candidatus Omnitrophota bacterium]
MDKKTILRNFSRSARLYDKYADIQNRIALQLIRQTDGKIFSNILELGCGTGNYTRLLKERFPKARVKALDISEEMVEVAREKLKDPRIEFLIADAEEPSINDKFDLITSNACFHWLNNPGEAIAGYRRMLTPEGMISFTAFGPLTFAELDTVLSNLEGVNIPARSFMTKDKLEKILSENFREAKINEAEFIQTFKNLRELMERIKYTGIRGVSVLKRDIVTVQYLNRIEDEYLKRFGGIQVTYQVFFCSGINAS